MSATIESFPPQRVVKGVTVVYAVELLDLIYPRGWTRLPPHRYQQATAAWLSENDALHFSWIGAASERYAKEEAAVDRAKQEGCHVVLIDALYQTVREADPCSNR
jgi:hypothetical protein